MGLGFTFGARDEGLESTLANINAQFKQINDTLMSFQEMAAGATTPVEGIASSIQDELADLQKEADTGIDLEDAIDIGGAADEAKDSVGGVTDELGGMAAEAALGGSKFGRMANSVLGGAGKITGALGWVGLALGPVVSGFGEAAESAGGMIDTIADIPARAGRSIHRLVENQTNLTHSLEGEALGFATSARAIGVNMGYLGADLNRFTGRATGMAMGLNIGAEEAARAIRAWDESASELGATGLRSAQDVARLTAALGINADTLRNSTLEMRNLGATDDQIRLVTSSIALMGRETGDLAGAMGELPQVIQMLERRRALGDTPEQMAAFAADTAAAARGLFEFTQDSDRARSIASSLAQTVTEGREAFQNMFAGTEDQLPQFVSELAITTGSARRAFDMMREGPGGMIEGIGQLVQATQGDAGRFARVMEFFRGRLQTVFGAETTATLVDFWGTMDSETVAAMDSIRSAEVDLGDLARQAHRTGRTMDEVFERMRGFFQVAMRRFARADSREFLRNTRASLRDLRVAAEEAHRSTGPLSDVMGLLSRSQQLGALALMPAELRGSAVAADELRGQIMPLVEAFSSWGGIFDTVLGYVSIFATDVISSWGRITRASRRAGGEAIDPMEALGQAIDQQANRYAGIFERWIGSIENWVVRAAESFGQLNFDALFAETPEGEEDRGVMGAIRRVLNRLEDVDWARIWAGIRTGLNNLFEHVRPWLEEKVNQMRDIVWNRIGTWWNAIDWDALFRGTGEVGSGLWSAFEPALTALGRLIGDWLSEHWWEIIMYGAIALTAAMAALIVLGVAALVATVVALAALIVGVVLSPFIAVYVELEAWGGEIVQFFHALWLDITRGIENFGEDFDDWLLDLDAGFRRRMRGMTNWFRSAWDAVASWFESLWENISAAFNQAVEDWQMIFDHIIEFFAGIGTSIRDSIGGAIAWIGTQWDAFIGGLEGVWEGLSAGWTTFLEQGEAFWTALTGLPDRIREGWSGMVEFFRSLFASIREVVGEDLAQVGQFFQGVADVGARALRFITGTAEEEFGNSIHTYIEEDLAAAETIMTETATSISNMITAILHDATVEAIITGFQTGFAAVIEDSGSFSEAMVEAFSDMADRISEIMTDLFGSVTNQALVTMLATETAVEGIIGRLRAITAAQERIAEAGAEARSEALARPADEAAMRRRLAELEGSHVLEAIHYPDWYDGSGPGAFKNLFRAKMDNLHAAIIALGATPAATALAERRRVIQEAGTAIERGRRGSVGGQPGLPTRGAGR